MLASKTNIQIHHQGVAAGINRFTTAYRSSNSLHAAPVNLSQRANQQSFTRKQSADLTTSKGKILNGNNSSVANSNADLRKAHFTLGTDNFVVSSTNQSALGTYSIQNNQSENR